MAYNHKRRKFTKKPLVHMCLFFPVFICDISVEHRFIKENKLGSGQLLGQKVINISHIIINRRVLQWICSGP
jgi:hypothetical protein